MIENPVSTISTYWRKPDHTFDPCDYGGYLESPGDAYTKKTCLWTGNGFVMPETKRIPPTEGSRMHKLPPSSDLANLRSATAKGFARAVFEANRNPTPAEVEKGLAGNICRCGTYEQMRDAIYSLCNQKRPG